MLPEVGDDSKLGEEIPHLFLVEAVRDVTEKFDSS